MCGLTGFWRQAGGATVVLHDIVEKMTDTLVHRGPDDYGIFLDENHGLAIGFRRLSIIDTSPAGHQPMVSADGRYVIAFNGEIYNYRELRSELPRDRQQFRSHSDTEVILAGFVLWGIEATLKRLVGMFAVAVWDQQEHVLFLARDRLGIKPLYYSQSKGSFLFGSELKALFSHPDFEAQIDHQSVAAFLRFGYVPTPYCIYSRTRKLRPGHYLRIQEDLEPQEICYWSAQLIVEQGLADPMVCSETEMIDSVHSLLLDSVAHHMIADVPLGAFLSGGIDSSTVVALMQAQSERPVRTFSIGFHQPEYDEAPYASAIAAHLKTEHTELYVSPEEARAVIPLLPELYDEPFADASQIPTYLVSRLARQHVTVSLSGDGGDELFGGYTRYLLAQQIWRNISLFSIPARSRISASLQRVPPQTWDAFYQRIEPVVPGRYRQRLFGDKIHKLAGVLSSPDQDTLYRQLISLWKTSLVIPQHEPELSIPAYDPQLLTLIPNYLERMMFLDLVTYLPDCILTKVDRASMGAKLEARVPLLDHRLVEMAWRLPLKYKFRNGSGKWLLRKILYRYVPPALVERSKMGFGVPIGQWLKGPLREWAEELLAVNRLRREGLLRPEPIRQAWAEHLAGHRDHQYRLWAVLMFQAWQERWVK